MQGFNLTLYPSCLGTGIHCINKVLDGIGTIDTVIDHGQVKRCRAACHDQVRKDSLLYKVFIVLSASIGHMLLSTSSICFRVTLIK